MLVRALLLLAEPPSLSPHPLLQRATFALSCCLPSGYFRGGHIACPPCGTYCSPSTVIALLSFITASVNVTAQSVDCPFMSTAPKQCFVSVCPHLPFYVQSHLRAISTSNCLQGYNKTFLLC